MLCLSKKTEYALIALAHLAERPDRVASAREVAQEHGLPLPLLMNILKGLQGHGILGSMRGVKGGYRLAGDLAGVNLYDFVAMVECSVHGASEDCGCLEHAAIGPELARVFDSHGPVQALQLRLVGFLKEVRVADLVMPGRRIDVPLERLRFKKFVVS